MDFGKRVFLVLCGACVFVDVFAATTHTVTSNADSGAGTFREAAGLIVAGDTIDFALANEQITLLTDVIIPVDCTLSTSVGSTIFNPQNNSKIELGANVRCIIDSSNYDLGFNTDTGQQGGVSGFTVKGAKLATFFGSSDCSGDFIFENGTVMAGANTCLGLGSVFMSEGTILLLTDGVLLSNAIFLGTNGGIILDVSNPASLLGDISGSGSSIEKTDAGVLTLSGNNSYSGGTLLTTTQITLGHDNALGTGPLTMSTGTTLALGSGISAANAIDLLAGASGTLEVTTGIGTLSGSLNTSTGSYIKSGAGTLVLSGTSAFSGTLAVNAGTCTFNGVFPGDVSTQSGVTVKGTGSIGGALTVDSGATLTPGNSIGTITVGSLSLDAGSTTTIEFDPTSASLIAVTGTANLLGTLHLIHDAGAYSPENSYEILTAGTVNGTFGSITGGIAGFAFTLDYTSNNVTLSYTGGISNVIFTDGMTGNILNFADYLNAYAPKSAEYLALAELPKDELAAAVNSTSPARNAFGPYVTQQMVFSLSHMVTNYLDNKRFMDSYYRSATAADMYTSFQASLKEEKVEKRSNPRKGKKYNLWVNGFVDLAHQVGVNQNTYFNFTSEGVLIGLDYQEVPNSNLGIVFAAAFSQIEDGQKMGSSDIAYGAASIYADYYWKNIYLKGAFWGVFHQIDNRRNIVFPGVDTKASAYIYGVQIDPHLELGFFLKDYSLREMQPYVAFDYVMNWEGSYSETGAGNLNMHQKSQESSMLQSVAGIRFYQEFITSATYFGFKEGISYINRTPFGTGTVNTSILDHQTLLR